MVQDSFAGFDFFTSFDFSPLGRPVVPDRTFTPLPQNNCPPSPPDHPSAIDKSSIEITITQSYPRTAARTHKERAENSPSGPLNLKHHRDVRCPSSPRACFSHPWPCGSSLCPTIFYQNPTPVMFFSSSALSFLACGYGLNDLFPIS